MEFRINYTRTTFNLELIVSVHQKLEKKIRKILYVAQVTRVAHDSFALTAARPSPFAAARPKDSLAEVI